MIEKVSCAHPDKIADRIAGAIVDLAYKIDKNAKIAVEVLVGHNNCYVVIESNIDFDRIDKRLKIEGIVERITGIYYIQTHIISVPQDEHLADNQKDQIRCGDNGIFKGVPLTDEEKKLSQIARTLYGEFKSDGKYILADDELIICQSNARNEEIFGVINIFEYKNVKINPLGYWEGGINVDTGATNRKLGSDMGHSVTGGGLHGKSYEKADVAVNIYAFLKAQETGKPVELHCAIGDTEIDGKPYEEIVEIARKYIDKVGGFEKFAEWGLF